MKTRHLIFSLLMLLGVGLWAAGCAQPQPSNPPAGPENSTPIAATLEQPPSSATPMIGPALPEPTASSTDDAAVAALTLENTPWLLRDFANDGLKPLLAIYSVTLQLNSADITASGISACNRYSSPYTLKGSALTFGAVMSTMRACTEMPGTVESTYQPLLAKVASYQIVGDSLVLSDGNGKMLLRFDSDPFSRAKAFTHEELANATYRSPFSGGGTLTLINGEYRDTASGSTLVLSNYAAFGDITADGQEDAVVVLVASGGGTGTFYYLTVVQRQGDQWVDAQTLIGDRVRLNSLQIAGDQIVVDMLIGEPDDPQCCPTIQTVQRYRWAGTQLELLDLLESR